MNRVADAVARLRSDGVLSEAQAAFLSRVARGDLLSIRIELQLLLWAGVSLIAAGLGILVKEHYDQIGPLTITFLLLAATALAFGYVIRRLPAFAWGGVPSPTLAFDYLLLLGVLLLGTDLAWIEYRFTPLGQGWPQHLLIYALLLLPIAYRCDSRASLSLALTSLAAWRGVSIAVLSQHVHREVAGTLRLNAIVLAAAFLAAAAASRVSGRKPHFEQVFGNLGLALLFGALLSGAFGWSRWDPGRDVTAWLLWLAATAGGSCAVMAGAWRLRRSSYFAFGLVAAWLAMLRIMAEVRVGMASSLFGTVSAIAVILILLRVRRRFRGEAS